MEHRSASQDSIRLLRQCEFGYWLPGPDGELVYHSVSILIREKAFQNEEIWNIQITPQGVLFQSFAFIYRYEGGQVQKLEVPGNILFVHSVRNRLLLEVIDKGAIYGSIKPQIRACNGFGCRLICVGLK